MKPLSALIAAALLLAPSLSAQDRLSVDPARQVNPEPAEVPLIPQEVPQNEKPAGGATAPTTFKRTKTDESTEALNQRIRFREARTKALRDPGIQAEWENSVKAKTDLEKREALKRYYKLLFARIGKIDGSLKKLIAERQTIALRRLDQTRIDATESLESVGSDIRSREAR